MLGGFLGQLLGGSRGGSVGGIYATVGADISDYERKMRQADQTMKRTASSMAGELDKGARIISQGLGGIGAAVGIGGALVLAKQVGSAVTELNALGAESQRMNAAFVEQWGERAPAAMEALRAASHGAISDMDLMLAANKAQMLGVTDDYNELARLLEVAAARGRALGIGTAQAFDNIATGIGRLSPMILDNLGIMVEADTTYGAYAETLGKTADELTDVEKRAALTAKVIGEAEDVTLDAAGSFEALTAAKVNLRTQIGLVISDFVEETGVVGALTEKLNDLAEASRGKRERRSESELAVGRFDAQEEWLIRNTAASTKALGELRSELEELKRQYDADLISQYAFEEGIAEVEREAAKLGQVTVRQLRDGTEQLNNELRIFEARNDQAALAASRLAEREAEAASRGQVLAGAALAAANGLDIAAAAAANTEEAMKWAEDQARAYAASLLAVATAGPGVANAMQTARFFESQQGPEAYTVYTGPIEGIEAGGGYGVGYYGVERLRDNLAATTEMEQEAYQERLSNQRDFGASTVDEAERTYNELARLVESALSPTAVTAADLAATAAGTYVDKWDEYMRRVRMPESGLDAAQIAEQERLFYSGQLMGEIREENWDALAADVQRKIDEKIGRERLLDEAMRQIQERGIGASQSQVAAAMGITGYKPGTGEAEQMSKGLTAAGLGIKFTEEFEKEFTEQQQRWIEMGSMSVQWMATGIEQGTTPQVTMLLVNLLAPRLQEALMGGLRP